MSDVKATMVVGSRDFVTAFATAATPGELAKAVRVVARAMGGAGRAIEGESAEDLVSGAYVAILAGSGEWRPGMEVWQHLARMATNRLRTLQRRAARHDEADPWDDEALAEHVAYDARVPERLDAGRTVRALEASIATRGAPRDVRALAVLCGGASNTELGEALGVDRMAAREVRGCLARRVRRETTLKRRAA